MLVELVEPGGMGKAVAFVVISVTYNLWKGYYYTIFW